MTEKIKSLTTEMLKEIAILGMDDHRPEMYIVHAAIMEELMHRMPVPEFVAFCDCL